MIAEVLTGNTEKNEGTNDWPESLVPNKTQGACPP